MTEPLLLTTTAISTFLGEQLLTGASGFFFERDGRLFLVTSRHVVVDAPTRHFPDRIEFEFHTDPVDLTRSSRYSMLLYWNGASVWRQGQDSGGEVDVAAIEIDKARLPPTAVYRAFTTEHIAGFGQGIEVGTPLLIVGFPLSFHDTLHHLPVARQGVIASSYGLRFQGQGYFLTDARTHRGTSGAPVVVRATAPARTGDPLPWLLLGVHSATLDMRTRDDHFDESLGLNCTWYADILLALTCSA